jgi:hypothetical protein
MGTVWAEVNNRIELVFEAPKIDLILRTLIKKINAVVEQIKNPILRLAENDMLKNFVKQLADLRIASNNAIYQMEILDTVINPYVINNVIIELEKLFDNNHDFIKNINKILDRFSKYLDSVLCILNDMNSVDDDRGCDRKYIKGL